MATTFNDGDPGTLIREKLNALGTELDSGVSAAASSAQAAATSATEAEGYKTTLETAFGGVSYLPPVEYASGIEIDSAVKTVEYEGEVYAALPSTVPFTTSGTFETDKFRIINSNANVLALDSIADLIALPAGLRREDMRYLVKGYHADTDVGGGEFYWDSASTAADNGGTVFEVSGVATGRFVRIIEVAPSLSDYSVSPDGVTEVRDLIQSVLDSNGAVIVNEGDYLVDDDHLVVSADHALIVGVPGRSFFKNDTTNQSMIEVGDEASTSRTLMPTVAFVGFKDQPDVVGSETDNNGHPLRFMAATLPQAFFLRFENCGLRS